MCGQCPPVRSLVCLYALWRCVSNFLLHAARFARMHYGDARAIPACAQLGLPACVMALRKQYPLAHSSVCLYVLWHCLGNTRLRIAATHRGFAYPHPHLPHAKAAQRTRPDSSPGQSAHAPLMFMLSMKSRCADRGCGASRRRRAGTAPPACQSPRSQRSCPP